MSRTVTVATWNINSLRLRQDLLAHLMRALAPDILCLQETKVPDELFPDGMDEKFGFTHIIKRGMKGYNGVAIFSKLALTEIKDSPDWCEKGDCRHIAAVAETGGAPVMLHDFYVPAGGDVPDPASSEKFAHKLAFIEEARAHFAAEAPVRTVLMGDLNIAPLEHDVWSHKQMANVVSHTPPEIEGLNAWMAAGFADALRHFVPGSEKLYTWWSYRNRDWRASDRGRRLDHVWVSRDMREGLRSMTVLKEARDWPRTSDHVPVAVTLEV
jgi:exodeoxyribonuclease-3